MSRARTNFEILERHGLSPTEKLVALTIALHLNADGIAWPSVSRLANLTALAPASVYRALRVLTRGDKVRGVQAIFERVEARRMSNTYRLRDTAQASQCETLAQGDHLTPELARSRGETSPVSQGDSGALILRPELPKKDSVNSSRNEESPASARTPAQSQPRRQLTDALVEIYRRKYDERPTWYAKDYKALDDLARRLGSDDILRRFEHYLKDDSDFYKGHRLSLFCSHADRWLRPGRSASYGLPSDMGFDREQTP